MARKHSWLRSSVLMTSSLSFMLVAGIALAQDKPGTEAAAQPVATEKAAENAVEKSVDKAETAVDKAVTKAEEAVKAIEKKEEKPAVGVGAAAPGSHQGFIPTVSTQYGSITVLGVFQTLFDTRYTLTQQDSAASKKDDRFDKLTFTFQRARFIVKGHVVSKDLTYFFQGEAANEKSFALDMTVAYKLWDTGLSVRVGRFVPDFSYMMPRNTADLAAINYPLYLNSTTSGNFAVWRQLGFDITYQPKPLPELIIKVGVFNGMLNTPYATTATGAAIAAGAYMQMGSISVGNYTPATGSKTDINVSNTTDNNRAKDVMLRVTYKPMKTLSVDFSAWLGFPANYNTTTGKLLRDANGELSPNDTLIMGGPGVEYNDGKLHAVGEIMWRYLKHREGGVADQKSLAVWSHAGYRVTDLIEAILRLDLIKMDMDANERADNNVLANMWLMRVTTGPHFWLEEKHFRILVNLFCDIPLEQMEKRQTNLGLQAQFAALW